jgi:hypothetical protein
MPSPGITPSFTDLANCSPLDKTTLLVLGDDLAGQFWLGKKGKSLGVH